MGYKRVYHGTSIGAAQKIRQEGLLSRYGGTGTAATDVAMGRPQAAGYSAGHVYVSPARSSGQYYARAANMVQDTASKYGITVDEARKRLISYPLEQEGLARKYSGPLSPSRHGVLKIDLPYDTWHSKFQADPLVRDAQKKYLQDAPEGVRKLLTSDRVVKAQAAKAPVDIPSHLIHGGAGRTFAGTLRSRLQGLPAYIRAHPGRFARGVGLAGLGVGAIGTGAALAFRHKQGQ